MQAFIKENNNDVNADKQKLCNFAAYFKKQA